jgi:hypothetical protein
MTVLACPDCPFCGNPPAYILPGHVQAWCSNEACEVWVWNPSKTQAENRADAGKIELPDWMR